MVVCRCALIAARCVLFLLVVATCRTVLVVVGM